MALSSSVHDLRTLIRSCHPLITIETVEEERVLALLQSVAAQERMPLFEWSVTRGLTRHDDGPTLSKMTATPLAVLPTSAGSDRGGDLLAQATSRRTCKIPRSPANSEKLRPSTIARVPPA